MLSCGHTKNVYHYRGERLVGVTILHASKRAQEAAEQVAVKLGKPSPRISQRIVAVLRNYVMLEEEGEENRHG
jgi:hypothetical protein